MKADGTRQSINTVFYNVLHVFVDGESLPVMSGDTVHLFGDE